MNTSVTFVDADVSIDARIRGSIPPTRGERFWLKSSETNFNLLDIFFLFRDVFLFFSFLTLIAVEILTLGRGAGCIILLFFIFFFRSIFDENGGPVHSRNL